MLQPHTSIVSHSGPLLPVIRCQLLLDDDTLSAITADLDGPVGTPFESGRFRVRLTLPADFPNSPPKGYFCTKIFHPNVSAAGEICVNTLKKDWQPSHGLRHVLLVLRCLLIQPNPESALNEEAGRLLMEEYSEYDRRARLMTRLHASGGKRTAGSGVNGGSNSSTASPLKTHKEEGGPSKGERETKAEAADDEEAGGQENAQLHANSPTNAKRPQGAESLRSASTSAKPPTELAEAKKRPAAAVVSKLADKPKAMKKTIKRL